MSQSPIFLYEGVEDCHLASVSDIACKMGGVARFIEAEYLTGLQAATMPTRTLLLDLLDRLLNYGWPLVSPRSLYKLDLPGKTMTFKPHEAVEAMEGLAAFFEQRARTFNEARLGSSENVKLSKELRFAARYTEVLLASLKDGESTSATTTEPSSETSGSVEEFETPEASPVQEYVQYGSQLVQKSLWPARGDSAQPPIQTQTGRIRAGADSQQSSLQDRSAAADLQTGSEESSKASIPRELQGRRLTGQNRFENDAKFSELIGQIKQWRELNPDFDFTTIAGGNDDDFDDLLQHFCDARPLGISALFIINCEHPLDPDVVKHLDLDVLRFVRLALWDCTNGHPERVAERQSFETVRREMKARKGEIAEIVRRAAEYQPSDQSVDRRTRQPSAPEIRGEDGLAGEEAMLQPDWLSPDYETPGAEESSIRVAKAQTMIPVGMPTDFTIRGPKGKAVQDTEEFTTLQRRTKLAALGVETKPKGSRPSVSPSVASLPHTEEHAFLQGVNDTLKKQLATLEDEMESLRPLDSPPKGSRTDDTQAHPLQYLVGSEDRPATPSMEALLDSESEDHLETDEDSKRHTRSDGMSLVEFLKKYEPPPSPTRPRETSSQRTSPNRWLQPFNGMIKKARKPISNPIPHTKSKPLICEGDHGEPKTYIPKQALKSSRGRERVDRAAREESAEKDTLDSAPIYGQPGNRSVREV